jgi:hypothetical protein
MWMRMTPLDDGKKMSDQACWGCMPDGDYHFCSEQEYQTYLGTHDDDHTMKGMNHGEMIVSHGGSDGSVQAGPYRIDYLDRTFVSGEPSHLSFLLTDSKGEKVTSLDIEHEKPMHLVLVRADLQYFDHLHPSLEGAQWETPVTFLAPGNYRVWVDFTKDMQHYLVDFDFIVGGTESQPEPHRLGEFSVNSNIPQEVPSGMPSFEFTVMKNGIEMPITETFLGANAHLILIDATRTEFVHDHDMTLDGDGVLSFTPILSHPGLHRAWVQFIADGKDRIATFPFTVKK